MAAIPFDSGYLGALFGDCEIGAFFSDTAEIDAMIAVERALARAQGRIGIIPADTAHRIDMGLKNIVVDPQTLAAGTAAAGVPIPSLVAQLRAKLPSEVGQWLHWGATSQDIIDSALALRLGCVLEIYEKRLDLICMSMESEARKWARLPMAGRTRSQVAAPISFGLRIARWRQPLRFLRTELARLRPYIARAQLGGAVGSNSALWPNGAAARAEFAQELGLADSPVWHVDRSGLAALSGWCAQVTTALAKLGADLILLGRTESGEAKAGEGGGSSTMPQKSNPVTAEIVIALSHLVASLSSAMHVAAMQAEERDGASWSLEWLTLPQITIATGSALLHAQGLVETLRPNGDRMAKILASDGDAAMAEAASFALAAHIPREAAQTMVKKAVVIAQREGLSLTTALAELGAPAIDLNAALDVALDAAEAAVKEALLSTVAL